jgi:hypothetical protein
MNPAVYTGQGYLGVLSSTLYMLSDSRIPSVNSVFDFSITMKRLRNGTQRVFWNELPTSPAVLHTVVSETENSPIPHAQQLHS